MNLPHECRTPVCIHCGNYQGPLGDWFKSPDRPWQTSHTRDVECPTCASLLWDVHVNLTAALNRHKVEVAS